jgi:hypothetical protein
VKFPRATRLDAACKYHEIERELLLLDVATVWLDADKLLHDQLLNSRDTHNWRHVGYATPGITSIFRLPRKEQPTQPDAGWSLANLGRAPFDEPQRSPSSPTSDSRFVCASEKSHVRRPVVGPLGRLHRLRYTPCWRSSRVARAHS